MISSCQNILTTKQGARRQNILNGSFCQVAALMRPTSPCLTATLPSRGGWGQPFKWSGSHFSPEKAVIASCASCLFWFNECRGAGITIRGTGRQRLLCLLSWSQESKIYDDSCGQLPQRNHGQGADLNITIEYNRIFARFISICFFRFLFEEKALKRTVTAPLPGSQIIRCLNVLTTKCGNRRQNILNGSFCRAAALMRPGTSPLCEAANTSAPIWKPICIPFSC